MTIEASTPSASTPGRLTSARAYETEADHYYLLAAQAADAGDEAEAGRLFSLHRQALRRARNLAPRPLD